MQGVFPSVSKGFFCLAFIASGIAFAQPPPEFLFKERYMVKVESCHIGGNVSGPIELQLLSNGNAVFNESKKIQPAKSPDINFDKNFVFEYLPGDSISVKLLDNGRWWKKEVLSLTSSSPSALFEIMETKLEHEKSSLKFKMLYPAGKYNVALKMSYLCDDDLTRVGGMLPDTGKYERMGRAFADAVQSEEKLKKLNEMVVAEIKNVAKEKIADKVEHYVKILQNGNVIFDSWDKKQLCGQTATWDDLLFDIDWKPGDKIEVFFYDADDLIRGKNDLVFEKMSNTQESINIFNGALRGGKNNNSFLAFELRFPSDFR